MQVRDIMIPVVGSVQPDTPLRDAIEKIKALDLDPMPVTENGHMVGVITGAAISERATRDLLATGSVRVSEVMSSEVVCCTEDQSVAAALDHIQTIMGDGAMGRLPVTDSSGELVGILSIADLRSRATTEGAGTFAVEDVNAVDQLVKYDDDKVDYMSDGSFPASDPPAQPSTAAAAEEG